MRAIQVPKKQRIWLERISLAALLVLPLLGNAAEPGADTQLAAVSAAPSASSQPEVEPELRRLLRSSIEQADSFADRFDAEVWLVQKSAVLAKYIKDPRERLELLRLVHREAHRAGIPPEFVLAVIEVESHFDRYAVSSAGAQGMMQIMPFWKNEIGREDDNLIDVRTNLRYGCTILKYYYDRAKGNWAEALARYNGSFGYYWNYSEKVMVAWQENWR